MKPNQDTPLVAPVLENTFDILFSIERLASRMAEQTRGSSDNSAFEIAVTNMSTRLTNDLIATLQSMNEEYELDTGDVEVEFLLCQSHDLAHSIRAIAERFLPDNSLDALVIIPELARSIGEKLNKVKEHYQAIGLFDDKEATMDEINTKPAVSKEEHGGGS